MQEQWLIELQEQVKKDWKNYVHRRIELTEARVDERFLIPGEFIYVEERSSLAAVAQIKLNRKTNDALDLEKGVEIRTTFTKVFITNAALEDEWIDVIFGINFSYKKKIISPEEIDAALNFLLGGPITTPPGVDLVILPGAGGITQIGDAGATSHSLNANDDLFVSGRFEIDGYAYFDGLVNFNSAVNIYGSYSDLIQIDDISELITIPVGQGAAGIVSAANLVPANTTILGVSFRVIQAPGGGATTIDIGRTGGGNLDEFIDGASCDLLGETGTFAANHDAATLGTVFNVTDNTLTLTTDANVLVSDMIVRVVVKYRIERAPQF